jgi:hypothetical protein
MDKTDYIIANVRLAFDCFAGDAYDDQFVGVDEGEIRMRGYDALTSDRYGLLTHF